MDTIKQIINRFGIITKKHLGQNFILDENITNKIVKLTDVKNEIILEIGPGPGCLTRSLVKSGAKKAGKKNRLFFKVQNILFPGKYETGSKILNNEKWTNKVIELTNKGKSADDITSVLMKSDKKINRNILMQVGENQTIIIEKFDYRKKIAKNI